MDKSLKIKVDGRMGENRKPGDVGYDLYVAKDTIVLPYARIAITTESGVELPYNVELEVRPRSGFSVKGIEAVPLEMVNSVQNTDQSDMKDGVMVVQQYFVPYPITMRMDADVIVGTVDPDFPNKIGAIVHSHDSHAFLVKKGTRIAQGVFHDVITPTLVLGEIGKNENRDGGFGTSGSGIE